MGRRRNVKVKKNSIKEKYSSTKSILRLNGLGHAILSYCLILSVLSSKHQIGRAGVFHLQNQGYITTENDFPAV